jgi:membrane protein
MNCKPKKKTMYGSVFTSILLMISTWGYSIYMEYFTDFESYYGGVATLLSLMIYLNLISLVFVLGMSINYARDKIMHGEISNKKETKKDKAQ